MLALRPALVGHAPRRDRRPTRLHLRQPARVLPAELVTVETTYLVRLLWTAPGPADHTRGAPVTQQRTEACPNHAAAHAVARQWATSELPAGTDHTLTIEIRNGLNVRTEPWRIGSTRSEAAEQLDAQRRGLAPPPDNTPQHLARLRAQLAAARRPDDHQETRTA